MSAPVRVLDSWAILAMIQGEPAAQRVSDLMAQGDDGKVDLIVSAINYAEVVYRLHRLRKAADADNTIVALKARKLRIVPVDDDLAYRAGRLKALHPISISDCVAAALAIREGAPLISGDHDFDRIGEELVVEYLR